MPLHAGMVKQNLPN